MNDKNETKRINQDVQATGEEAGRLLEKLERGTQSTRTQTNSAPEADSSTNKTGGYIIVFGLVSLIWLIVLAGQYEQSSTKRTPNSSKQELSNTDRNDIEETPKQRVTFTGTQKNFYYNALVKSDQAVLKREHENAIRELNMLKGHPYNKFKEVNQRLVQDKVLAARKSIDFLDQPGESRYWEGNDYGYQWFDEQINGFKIFVAYSRKCKSPLITFGYRPSAEKRNGDPIKVFRVKPSSNTSTVYVPAYQRLALWVESFRCN